MIILLLDLLNWQYFGQGTLNEACDLQVKLSHSYLYGPLVRGSRRTLSFNDLT